MNRIELALRRIASELDSRQVRWALVGGFAVSVRTEPRFTRDVDVVVMVESEGDAEQLVRSLTAEGYGLSALVEQDAVGRLATVRLISPDADGVGVVVDLIFATAGIEDEIVADAEVLEILPAVSLPVATVGHLVALKLLARDDETRRRTRPTSVLWPWCSVPRSRPPPEPPSNSSWNAVTPGDGRCRQC